MQSVRSLESSCNPPCGRMRERNMFRRRFLITCTLFRLPVLVPAWTSTSACILIRHRAGGRKGCIIVRLGQLGIHSYVATYPYCSPLALSMLPPATPLFFFGHSSTRVQPALLLSQPCLLPAPLAPSPFRMSSVQRWPTRALGGLTSHFSSRKAS